MKLTTNKAVIGATVLVALFSTAAFAVPGLTHVNQKGSLLVFPLIDTSGARDTWVFLSNDGTDPIDVKCYYGEYTGDLKVKPTRDFVFTLTKNQPFYWSTRTGEGTVGVARFLNSATGTGELKCWAVSKGAGNQISWNHLSGVARVVDPEAGQSWEYSAYGFYCRAEDKKPCGPAPGRLDLDGKVYDQCGQYIIGQITPEGAIRGGNRNLLAVSSCTQDLSPVGSAKPIIHEVVIDVWNEDEVKFTGAKDEIDSWWRIHLGPDTVDNSDPVDVMPENLTFDQLGTFAAHYRLESEAGYGLMGVQVQSSRRLGNSATTVHHAGRRNGAINWRTQYDNPPKRQ